jgi:hypothetical protein
MSGKMSLDAAISASGPVACFFFCFAAAGDVRWRNNQCPIPDSFFLTPEQPGDFPCLFACA